jgi:quercetin dioxygenase-like cupin family protein
MPDQSGESRPPGADAGAPAVRASRPLAGPILTFDFAEEVERLRQEGPWLQHGRNAVTLVKHADFRIVLMLMRPGTRLQDHHTAARISVQTVHGHVCLHLRDRVVDLPAGSLLALEREVEHDVEAIQESIVLLTIAWPDERR